MMRCFSFVAPAVVLFASAISAAAQDVALPRAERPYRGLFASGVDDARQLLTLNASLGGGYDDSVLNASNAGADVRLALRGPFASGSAGAAYTLSLERVSFGASASTATRYYPDARDNFLATRSASAAISVQALRYTRISAAQSYTVAPYNVFSLFPTLFDAPLGQSQVIEDDFGIAAERYTRVATTAGIVQTVPLGRRTFLDFDYNYGRSHVSSRSFDYETHAAGGYFRREVTRSLGFRLGYHYRDARYPSAVARGRLQTHDADVGVDFNRALSLTRRTTLTMRTGTSALVTENRTIYRLIGDARLNREISRTWNASLAYNRNVGFVDTFDVPMLYDSVSAGVAGLITRRLQFASSLRASTGHVGFGADSAFRTYAGAVNLATALTRNIGIGASYFYYRYWFDSLAALPAAVSREMERQGVRAYVTVWAPVFYRARRP